MSIDRGWIDEDHKVLIGLVNAVDSVRPGPAARQEIAAMLDRLNSYTLVHFEREERLQAAARFINANAHRQYHDSVVRELDDMRGECASEMTSAALTTFQPRVSAALNDWLSDHILRSDALMKPFVAALRSFSMGAVSLTEAVHQRSQTANAP